MSKPRFWCHYLELEEFQSGMWRKVSAEDGRKWIKKAVELLMNQGLFRSAMATALKEWPVSCLYNFTNPSLNKPVWLAHAGACCVYRIPEKFMRAGYCMLDEDSKRRADSDAAEMAMQWTDPRA